MCLGVGGGWKKERSRAANPERVGQTFGLVRTPSDWPAVIPLRSVGRGRFYLSLLRSTSQFRLFALALRPTTCPLTSQAAGHERCAHCAKFVGVGTEPFLKAWKFRTARPRTAPSSVRLVVGTREVGIQSRRAETGAQVRGRLEGHALSGGRLTLDLLNYHRRRIGQAISRYARPGGDTPTSLRPSLSPVESKTASSVSSRPTKVLRGRKSWFSCGASFASGARTRSRERTRSSSSSKISVPGCGSIAPRAFVASASGSPTLATSSCPRRLSSRSNSPWATRYLRVG